MATIAKSLYVALPLPNGRAEHKSTELLLWTSLQAKIIAIVKERCREARWRRSVDRATKECPLDLWGTLPRAWQDGQCPSSGTRPYLVPGTPVYVEKSSVSAVLRKVGKITSSPAFCSKPQGFNAALTQRPSSYIKNSMEMIREFGNVELFEVCETTRKVQCSHCLLYWNQGIVYLHLRTTLDLHRIHKKFYRLRLMQSLSQVTW